MSKYCHKHPDSSIEPDYNYGFRADTAHYSYMLRVTPKEASTTCTATVICASGWMAT